MAIYRLEVEKKFGQLRFRLHQNGAPPGEFGGDTTDMKSLLDDLDEALGALDTKSGGDTVIFRDIEYAAMRDLRETVRFSKF